MRIRILVLLLPIFMATGACRSRGQPQPGSQTRARPTTTATSQESPSTTSGEPTPKTAAESSPAAASGRPAPPPEGSPLAVFGSYRMLAPDPGGRVDLPARQRIGGIPIVFESQRLSLQGEGKFPAERATGPTDVPQTAPRMPDEADPWRRFYERTLILVRGRVVTEELSNPPLESSPQSSSESSSGGINAEKSTYLLADDKVDRCGQPSPFLDDLGEELIVLIDGACLTADLPGVQWVLQFQSGLPDGGWLSATADLKRGAKNYVPIDIRGTDYHGGGRLLASNVASLITEASPDGGSGLAEGQWLLGEVLAGKAMPEIVVWIEYP